jgi:hypothetical protein
MDIFEELIAALDSEDDLGKVIRSQIIVENILERIIESKVESKDYLRKIDFTFDQKTKLALAFGVDSNFAKPIKCIGTMRNNFAHNLRGKINESDSNNFYKTFTPKNKEIMRKLYKNKEAAFNELGFPPFEKLAPDQKFALCVTVLAGALEAWAKHRAPGSLTSY